MSIIEVLNENGDRIILNPKHIVSVSPTTRKISYEGGPTCDISMSDGCFYTVRESIDNMAYLLEYAN